MPRDIAISKTVKKPPREVVTAQHALSKIKINSSDISADDMAQLERLVPGLAVALKRSGHSVTQPILISHCKQGVEHVKTLMKQLRTQQLAPVLNRELSYDSITKVWKEEKEKQQGPQNSQHMQRNFDNKRIEDAEIRHLLGASYDLLMKDPQAWIERIPHHNIQIAPNMFYMNNNLADNFGHMHTRRMSNVFEGSIVKKVLFWAVQQKHIKIISAFMDTAPLRSVCNIPLVYQANIINQWDYKDIEECFGKIPQNALSDFLVVANEMGNVNLMRLLLNNTDPKNHVEFIERIENRRRDTVKLDPDIVEKTNNMIVEFLSKNPETRRAIFRDAVQYGHFQRVALLLENFSAEELPVIDISFLELMRFAKSKYGDLLGKMNNPDFIRRLEQNIIISESTLEEYLFQTKKFRAKNSDEKRNFFDLVNFCLIASDHEKSGEIAQKYKMKDEIFLLAAENICEESTQIDRPLEYLAHGFSYDFFDKKVALVPKIIKMNRTTLRLLSLFHFFTAKSNDDVFNAFIKNDNVIKKLLRAKNETEKRQINKILVYVMADLLRKHTTAERYSRKDSYGPEPLKRVKDLFLNLSQFPEFDRNTLISSLLEKHANWCFHNFEPVQNTETFLAIKECAELLIEHSDDMRIFEPYIESMIRAGYFSLIEKIDDKSSTPIPMNEAQLKDYNIYKEWKKVDTEWLPQMLKHPIKLFSRPVYQQARQAIGQEFLGRLAIELGLIACVFQTPQQLWEYLERYGDNTRQAPLHDLLINIKLPKKLPADFDHGAWAAAIIRHGPKMGRLFQYANRIPKPLKGADGGWSYTQTLAEVAKFAYARSNEYPKISSLAHLYKWPEEKFEQAAELTEEYLKKYQANDNKKPTHIPEITIDGKEFGKDSVTFKRLPDGDIRGLFLGEMTDCCQHLNSAGHKCAAHGFLEYYGGFYVLENQKGDIVAQMWAWRGTQGELVLDSFEQLRGHFNSKQVEGMLELFAEKIQEAETETPVTRILIGTSGETPRDMKFATDSSPASPIDYAGYRDSNRQFLIKSFTPQG